MTPDLATAGDLLLATLPTPNGPLHLGHLSTFLRFDAAARRARADGRAAFLCGGLDSFESHVTWSAGLPVGQPAVLARHHGARIAADLSLAGVAFDVWIDPMSERWSEPYRRAVLDHWRALRRSGALVEHSEYVPFDHAAGLARVGAELSGLCPSCGQSMRGFLCEACGHVPRPDELIEPEPEGCPKGWTWERVASWLLELPDLRAIEWISDTSLARQADRDWVVAYLARRGPVFRASHPGRWGIAVPDPEDRGQVIYSYAAYPAFIELARKSLEERGLVSPHARLWSGKCLGIDNLVPTAVGTQLGLIARGERPLDFIAVNRFLSLDGAKFSTSRRHALWVDDLVAGLGLPADALRLFLALHAPEEEHSDFDVNEFADFFRDVWRAVLVPLVRERRRSGGRGLAALNELTPDCLALLEQQRRALRPDALSLRRAAELALAWICGGSGAVKPAATGHQIAGAAHLLAPICPSLAFAMGASASQVGDPTGFPRTALDEAALAGPEGVTAPILRARIG